MTSSYVFPTNSSATFNNVHPLKSPVYASLSDLGRTLHWDDVEMTYNAKMLIPQRFRNTNLSVVQNKEVLQYAPARNCNNFFGNVTFITDWPSILNEFGPNLYLIDQSIHHKAAYTRMLLTNSKYESLEIVNLEAEGSALMVKEGQFLHAEECVCNSEETGSHELQIVIEADAIGGKWLYDRCTVKAEDHTDVNHKYSKFQRYRDRKSYPAYKCYKFNTAQGQDCPFAFSANKVRALLASECPDLSESGSYYDDVGEAETEAVGYDEPVQYDSEPDHDHLVEPEPY